MHCNAAIPKKEKSMEQIEKRKEQKRSAEKKRKEKVNQGLQIVCCIGI